MHTSTVSALAVIAAAFAMLGCSAASPHAAKPADARAGGPSGSCDQSLELPIRLVLADHPRCVYGLADHMPRPPAEATVLAVAGTLEYGTSSFIALDGAQLIVRRVECGRCRRVMGWSFAGDPARMTDDELRALQERLGLDGDIAPLDSVAAWREAAMPSLESPR